MKNQSTKIKIALWTSSFISLITLFILLGAIESGVVWKITAASIGFLGFLGMTLMVLRQFLQNSK